MAQITDQGLQDAIEAAVATNGAGAITGAALQVLLKNMADNTPNGAYACDPTMTNADIGKTLGLNLGTGLVQVYQEEPAVAAESFVVEITFAGDISVNPNAESARVDITFVDNPADGETFKVYTGGIEKVFTFNTVDNIGLNVLIEPSLPETLGNLAAKIATLMTNATGSVTGGGSDILTIIADAEGVAPNGDWYIKDVGDMQTFFAYGRDASIQELTLVETDGNITTLYPNNWINYATPPADYIEEAANFAEYITANVAAFTAAHTGGTGLVTLTGVSSPDIDNQYSVTKGGLTNVTVNTTNPGVSPLPKRSKMPFVGFCGGVEDVEGTLYVIPRTGLIQVGKTVAKNPIDINELDIAINLRTTPSAFLCAADGGGLKTLSGFWDVMGIAGYAMHNVIDDPAPQNVVIKQQFLPLFI